MPLALPIDFVAVRIALVRTMIEVLQLPPVGVITAEPEVVNAPRPPKPYFTLKFMSGALRYGDDVPEHVDADTWNYGGPRGLAVSFNCYGRSHEEALGLMTAWQCALDQPGAQQALYEAGIAVWRIGAVADISVLMNTGYEGRAHMDCTLGLAANALVTVGSIEQASVEGRVAVDGAPDAIINLPESA